MPQGTTHRFQRLTSSPGTHLPGWAIGYNAQLFDIKYAQKVLEARLKNFVSVINTLATSELPDCNKVNPPPFPPWMQ
jgi:hypothetical protein